MPAPTLIFVTAGPWGPGVARVLDDFEVDTNFYNIFVSISDLIANPPVPISIDHFSIDANNNLIVHYTNATTQNVGPLPIAEFHDRGTWSHPNHYVYGDTFTQGSGYYLSLQEHDTQTPFDPDRLISGNPVYRTLFSGAAATMTYLDDGYPAEGETIPALSVFSVPDLGVYMATSTHDALAAFDPDALDTNGDPLYKKIFSAIETEIARIQFQYPGAFPADESVMWKLIQDDLRDLVIPPTFTGSIAHLQIAVTAELSFTFEYDGTNVGTLTFTPATLPDGDGGQYGSFTGPGATIANQELLRLISPDTADTTARFLTVAIVGNYEE